MTELESTSIPIMRNALTQLTEYSNSSNIRKYVKTNEDGKQAAETSCDTSSDNFKEMKRKYSEARSSYLSNRICGSLVASLSSFVPGSGFDIDEYITTEEEILVKKEEDEGRATLLDNVRDSSLEVTKLVDGLKGKYGGFEGKRGELDVILQELENNEDVTCNDIGTAEDELDYSITSSELQNQQDLLSTLLEKKTALKTKLLLLASEKEKYNTRYTSAIAQITKAGGNATKLLADGNTTNNEELSADEREANLTSLNEASEWYTALLSALSSLSDISIKGISPIPKDSSNEELVNGGIRIKLLVNDGKQIVSVGLRSLVAGVKPSVFECGIEHNEELKKETSGEDMEEEEDNATKVTIPNVEDILLSAKLLPPPDDLRFVVRETTNRIRNLQSRTIHLQKLKQKYVLKNSDNADEVIISIPNGVGVSCTIRFTKDYPLLPKSVYLQGVTTSTILSSYKPALSTLKTEINNSSETSNSNVIEIVESVVKGVRKIYEVDNNVVGNKGGGNPFFGGARKGNLPR